ncbi:MAG: hypothetical protein ACLUEQ_12170, partial [Cloacibacillus evryensis]
DLIMATGGPAMTKAAHSSGKPAYCSGAGNATMIYDETAIPAEAARNTRISKTSDFGSGCSADGNIIISDAIYDETVKALIAEGGYLATDEERALLKKAMWDEEGHRIVATVAVSPQELCRKAGFEIPADRKFVMVHSEGIGKEFKFSGEKLTTLLTIYKYEGEFENALKMMDEIYGRRPRTLLRHLQLRRGPHPAPRAARPRHPRDGAPAAVEGQRRFRRKRYADDFEHGLRHLGRQPGLREHRAQTLHEQHLGGAPDHEGPAR